VVTAVVTREGSVKSVATVVVSKAAIAGEVVSAAAVAEAAAAATARVMLGGEMVEEEAVRVVVDVEVVVI